MTRDPVCLQSERVCNNPNPQDSSMTQYSNTLTRIPLIIGVPLERQHLEAVYREGFKCRE